MAAQTLGNFGDALRFQYGKRRFRRIGQDGEVDQANPGDAIVPQVPAKSAIFPRSRGGFLSRVKRKLQLRKKPVAL